MIFFLITCEQWNIEEKNLSSLDSLDHYKTLSNGITHFRLTRCSIIFVHFFHSLFSMFHPIFTKLGTYHIWTNSETMVPSVFPFHSPSIGYQIWVSGFYRFKILYLLNAMFNFNQNLVKSPQKAFLASKI